MTIDDVEHYSEDEKKKIISSYPAHEMEARTRDSDSWFGSECPVAKPLVGASIEISAALAPFRGYGIRSTHPFAAVQIVSDRDTDTVYVSKAHRLKEQHQLFTLVRCAHGEKSCHGPRRKTEGAKLLRAPECASRTV